MVAKVLPDVTARAPAYRKCIPLSKVFTNPRSQLPADEPQPQTAAAEEALSVAQACRQAAAEQLARQILRQLCPIKMGPCTQCGADTDADKVGVAAHARHAEWQLAHQTCWEAISGRLLLFCMALMHKAGWTTFYGGPAERQSADTWPHRSSSMPQQHVHIHKQLCLQQSNSSSTQQHTSCSQQAAHMQGMAECHDFISSSAVQQLQEQLTSRMVRAVFRFGSGLGCRLAKEAGRLGLLDAELAAAGGRLWKASTLYQLNVRWFKVVARVKPCAVALLLRQSLLNTTKALLAANQGKPRARAGQQMQQWRMHILAAPDVEAAATGVPWVVTAAGSGGGGRCRLTEVGSDGEGSKCAAQHVLPWLRRQQRQRRAWGSVRKLCSSCCTVLQQLVTCWAAMWLASMGSIIPVYCAS